eukprot:CAMPEP_0180162754 /NCGR_PEP_ID=MMETSP0986-20121125/29401_1 /TAXON_ID=697907 /ORGANISM="non described non described, Strain CCMP2293" /LENGTH=131 /DNA_ID=CAMNT_0022113277 /DNA_START=23 /DNA_END=418 /DNA_ORIENTATION=+
MSMVCRALLVGLVVLLSLSWECASSAAGESGGHGRGMPQGDVVRPERRTRQERKRDLKHAMAGSAEGHEKSSKDILPGQKVVVSGLENAVELNGKTGIALRWRTGGRWTVRVAGREVDMKENNLWVEGACG